MFRFTWTRIATNYAEYMREPEVTVVRYEATATQFARVLANDPSVETVTIKHPEGSNYFVRQEDGSWA
jgi:hypothetical protein